MACLWCPRRDSNPHHQNRNLTFYPLNYGDSRAKIGIRTLFSLLQLKNDMMQGAKLKIR